MSQAEKRSPSKLRLAARLTRDLLVLEVRGSRGHFFPPAFPWVTGLGHLSLRSLSMSVHCFLLSRLRLRVGMANENGDRSYVDECESRTGIRYTYIDILMYSYGSVLRLGIRLGIVRLGTEHPFPSARANARKIAPNQFAEAPSPFLL